MKKIFSFLATLIVMSSFVFGLTGCPFKSALEKVEKLQNYADEMRIHNKNIAKANNEAFDRQLISTPFHLNAIKAADGFSKTLDGLDKAIGVAKKAKDTPEAKSALDYLDRYVSVEAFRSFTGVVEAVTDIPQEWKDRVEMAITAIKSIFAALRILFAEATQVIAPREEAYAE